MFVAKENFKKNNLNFIQFIMAILVIYSHAFPIATSQNGGEIIKDLTDSQYSCGNLAVAAFFIISGFLVSASYENSTGLFAYLKKRVFRIFPGFFAVLVLSALVLGPLVTTLPLSQYFTNYQTRCYIRGVFMHPLYWNLPGVFEQNLYGSSVNGSLWTIPYQFGFYILLGIVGFLGLLKFKKVSLSMFIAFVFAYLMKGNLFSNVTHFLSMPLNEWLYLGMYFTAGMTAYAYRDKIELNRQGAMLFLTLLLFAWIAKEYFISTSVLGTYLILYLGYCTKPVKCKMAKLSYGIYIYGFPVQQLYTHLFGGSMNPYLNIVLSVPVVLLLAWLSDKFIETPIVKLEKYVTLKPLIPQFVNRACGTIRSVWNRVLDRIAAISWVEYAAALLCAGVVVWSCFINLPSRVDFAENRSVSSRILAYGYYTQNENEPFVFVSDSSCIHLGQKSGMTCLEINGFLPETFTDVNSISVYYNDSPVIIDVEVLPGQMFSFSLPVPDHQMLVEKEVSIKIVFNAIHEVEPGNPDIRQLSACITSIGFKRTTDLK